MARSATHTTERPIFDDSRVSANVRIAPLNSMWPTDGRIHRLTSQLDWQFLFLENGKGQTSFNRTECRFEAGTLICVPPSAICDMALTEDARGTAIVIDEVTFRDQVLGVLPGNQNRTSSFWSKYYSVRILEHSMGADNAATRKNICAELETLSRYLGKGGDPAIVGSALVILFGRLQKEPNVGGEKDVLSKDTMSKGNLVIAFRMLVEQHYTDRLKVADYARLLGVTPRTLLRACQSMTGRKAVAIIHDRMILEATRLLRHSTSSVSEISYRLGFDDTGYFSRFIKAHAGHCPVELRRFF